MWRTRHHLLHLLLFAFILEPCLQDPRAPQPSWLKGNVAWEGLMQKDVLPCGVNTTECMFAFICILKRILKAPSFAKFCFLLHLPIEGRKLFIIKK